MLFRSIKDDPSHLVVFIDLASLNFETEKDEEALGLYKLLEAKECTIRSLNINPDNADALNRLGYIYFKLNMFKEAKENYLKALERNSQRTLAQMNLQEVEQILQK
ncbi:hypothetical protein ABPG74_002023 [Tetrahymena malaccensis]